MITWLALAVGIAAIIYIAGWWAARPPGRSRVEPAAPLEAAAAAPAKASRPETAPALSAPPLAVCVTELPRVDFEAEAPDSDTTNVGECQTRSMVVPKIVYDEDAVVDEPTHAGDLILVTGAAQTDAGLRRKSNADSMLILEEHGLFVVADGMGGSCGGGVASDIAVTTLEHAFKTRTFAGDPDESIPHRASELARAIQMANEAILSRAAADTRFEGMGTTLCAARFSSNKQRFYVGHVGDSRAYCLRAGRLRQMTSDHTMGDFGVQGMRGADLSRAVGIWPSVPVDLIIGKPSAGDVYLLCSDGLTRMVPDVEIERILRENDPQQAAGKLIAAAKEHGGKDNVTVVVILVAKPRGHSSSGTAGSASSNAA